MELNKINSTGNWGSVAEDINQNFSKVNNAVEQVKNATTRNKGYYSTEADLKSAFTTANVGDIAYVGSAYPYQTWTWDGTGWVKKNNSGGDEQVNLGNYYTKEETDGKFDEADEKLSELRTETDAKLSELASEVYINSKIFSGSNWIEHETYSMYPEYKYEIKNIGENTVSIAQAVNANGVSVVLEGWRELLSGEKLIVSVDDVVSSLRFYFVGQSSVRVRTIIDIDKELLNIENKNEELKGYVEKSVKELGEYEENEEYLRAYTDAEGKFLFGIKRDGSIEWAKGVPMPIVELINSYNIDLAKKQLERLIEQGDGYAIKDSVKRQLFVDCRGTQPYYTIKQAIDAVENPSSINQYEIIVFPGTYYENNLLVPAWTHIHGLRPNSVVVTSVNEKDKSSLPVFDQAYGSSKLSNMTIMSYTGYCIHFDSHKELAMSTLVNENLTLVKCHNNSVTNSIIGGGSFKYGTTYHWKNCTFVGDNPNSPNNVNVGCHTNKDAYAENTHIKFENCRFINCELSMLSVGGFGHCVCEIVNCTYDKGKNGLYTPFSWLRTIDMPNTFTANTIEWQFIGGGNKNFAPAVFTQGYGLCVESNSAIVGEEISVYGSAADDVLFGEILTQKGGNRIKASAIGSYMVSTNVNRGNGASDCFLIHKRLGNMTSNPKTLHIRVKNSLSDKVYSYTFDKDYTNMTDDDIIAEVNAILVGCSLSIKTPNAWDAFNLSEVRQITCADDNDILYGTWVTEDGKTCTSATPIDKIYGIALHDAVYGQPLRVWTGDAFHYEGGNLRDGEWGICDYINYKVDYPGSATNFGNISQSAPNKFGKMVGGKLYRY